MRGLLERCDKVTRTREKAEPVGSYHSVGSHNKQIHVVVKTCVNLIQITESFLSAITVTNINIVTKSFL